MFASASAGVLFLIAMAKILTTGLTVGSGGSGGVFGPAIAIGGGVGGSMGLLVSKYLPWFEVNPGAFVVVGMAGFFAAAANAPISTIIMVSEMTGNYHLLVPALWVCVIAYLLARKHALYEKQVPSRFDSPVHREGMLEAILKHFRIRTIVRRPGLLARGLKVAPEARLERVLKRRGFLDAPLLAVVDRRGRLQGILLPRELRRAQDAARHTPAVREVMRPPLAVGVEDTMEVALALMHEHGLEAIPVTRRGVFAGILERRKVLAGYQTLLEQGRGR
jgi:CIC family chloride channel protein